MRGGAILALAGAGLLALALLTVPEALPGAWLAAAWMPVSLGLGAMSLMALVSITGGRWAVPLAPGLRAMALLAPVGMALMVPVLFAGPGLFPWAGEGLSEAVTAKLGYLNRPMLALRFGVVAAVVGAGCLWTLARAAPVGRPAAAGAVLVLVGVVLGTSVLDIDLMLALQPEVVSTIHPLIQICGQAVAALAVAVALRPAETDPDKAENAGHMLLGLLILWGYMHYMQWLVIWAENLPTEIAWYLPRLTPGWKLWLWAGLALSFGGGLALCFRRVKRARRGLTLAAWAVAAGQGADVVWRVLPPAPGPGWPVAGALALMLGLGLLGLRLRLRRVGHA